jgi:hypothetical protein
MTNTLGNLPVSGSVKINFFFSFWMTYKGMNSKNDKHSLKVGGLLMDFAGVGILSWNISQWLPQVSMVSFIIKKQGFHGAICIAETSNEKNSEYGTFILGFHSFGAAKSTEVIIAGNALAAFIEKLGTQQASWNSGEKRESTAVGERAPQDENFACAAPN